MLWIENRAARKPIIYAETVFYTALVLGLCYLANPSDPLFLQSSFPWIWLISVVLALRAGAFVGLLSYATILVGFYLFSESAYFLLPTQLNLLGGLILTIICGEYSSGRSVRIRQLRQISAYAEQQLDLTAHAYYLLKQSHNHLEQQLIIAPATLRSSMASLRDLVRSSNGTLERTQCEHLLRLLSHYCSIQACGFYLWKHGMISTEAFCESELKEPLNLKDPILVRAMKYMIPYSNTKLSDVELKQNLYLAAFPVISFDKQCFAFFVIRKMPFFSYNEENFQMIRMMLEYYANSLVLFEKPMPLLKVYPDCSAEFAFELERMILLRNQLDTSSYLVCAIIENHARQDAILYELNRNHRGLDIQWKHKLPTAIAVIIIMPFCSYSDVVGYRNRVHSLPNVDGSINLELHPIKFSSLPIEKNSDAVELIKRLIAT